MPMTTRRHVGRTQRLERMLQQHVRELEERRHALRDGLTDESFGTHSESEWGFASAARGLGAGLLSISAHTVQSIEDALRRLESGTYGRCVDCLEPIPLPRLRALPFAQTCVACQERRDEGTGAFPAWGSA
jgi:RNA polymerase-binding transcription factor DksA